MVACFTIFIATLISYILNKIPMWMTALSSMCLLFVFGCINSSSALSGFSNPNTILMASMFVVANGLRRTTFVQKMVKTIQDITHGSFKLAYLGYVIITILLSSLIASPMTVYAIVGPLVCSFLDQTSNSRSKYLFPIMVICVSCCGVLPFSAAVQQAGQYSGFLEAYGFSDMTIKPIDFTVGAWPIPVAVLLWALFVSPKYTPDYSYNVIKNETKEEKISAAIGKKPNRAGILIFFVTISLLITTGRTNMAPWAIALSGALLMCLFKVITPKEALKEIPWDMILLYAGSLSMGEALTNTGAGEYIGSALAKIVGNTNNSYILGALFFLIPFILTQFMLNRSVVAVFIPICLLTCSALGANPRGLVILVNAASLTAFLTPMATPAVPMVMADAGYTPKDLFKSGWLITIALSVIYILYTMTVFPAFK